jgi:hypothetical protein
MDNDLKEYSQGWWMKEIDAAEEENRKGWWLDADSAVQRYLDERDIDQTQFPDNGNRRRYNIFWANVQIIKSAIYATPPKPDVQRAYGDAKDDVARTAALILQRILQFDFEKDDSDIHEAIKLAVEDRLIPGLGQAWLRYDVQTQKVVLPAVVNPLDGQVLAPAEETLKKVDENVLVEYVHYRDFLYPPIRTWNEKWWLGKRCWMRKKEFEKRFKGKWQQIAENAKTEKETKGRYPKGFTNGRAEVFELWCEESNSVYWVNRHAEDVLDSKEDPLLLDTFYPCPKPLMATHTTNKFVPRSDYRMVQDQYEELDILNARISILTKALRVVGVYDKNATEVKQIITGSEFNMIAVDNWAAFAEAGGLKGSVDWFPVEVIAEVLERLMNQRIAVINQIYELTSISDIMRGASNPRDTLGAQKLKAQYSSVRLQLMQQDVQLFVKQILHLKCEIIANWWDAETIKRKSQIEQTESAPYADAAIELIKNYDQSQYRIKIGEESMSLADYNAEREMRMELLTALGQFLSQSAGLVEVYPNALPYVIRMIQWVLASFRGSADIETVFDEAFKAAQDAPPQGENTPPDHSLEVAQLRAQVDSQKMQLDAQQMQLDAQVKSAEIASKEKMNQEDNQTTVLVELIKEGLESQKLEQAAIGMTLENEQANAERATNVAEADVDRMQAAEQADLDREQADIDRTQSAEQADLDRAAAAQAAKAKSKGAKK